MSKSAYQKNRELLDRLQTVAPGATYKDAQTLRRAALTLQHWSELECGNSNEYGSWAIERDPDTEIPYFVRYPYNSNKSISQRIPDREKGALLRVDKVCKQISLHFYHQTDPRGCPLFVSKEPLADNDYTRGLAITSNR